MGAPPAGTAVVVATSKWGGHPHWRMPGVLLGADEHGDWVGIAAGTRHARPGLAFESVVDSVTLATPGVDRLATFHALGGSFDTYVDVTTAPSWDATTLQAVDLDLDVVRLPHGTVLVDDEDEFEQHRVSLAYPEEVVVAARRSCAEVLAAVQAGVPPYDGATAARWLTVLHGLRRSAGP